MMINKADWEAAYRELIAEGRQEFGDSPSDEELLSYSRGELPEEREARIREFLVYYPELARVLEAPFPTPGEVSPDDLSDEELAQDWAALQARLPIAAAVVTAPLDTALPPEGVGRASRLWLWSWMRSLVVPEPGRVSWRLAALAAAALVVLGVLYVRALIDIRQLTESRAKLAHRMLLPDGQRSGKKLPILLSENADIFVLKPTLVGRPELPDYRLDIVDLNDPEQARIWSQTGLRPLPDESSPGNQIFKIWVPREVLKPGEYQLELYGLAEGSSKLLATYTVKVPAG